MSRSRALARISDAQAIAHRYEQAKADLAELRTLVFDELNVDQALDATDQGARIRVEAKIAHDRQMEMDCVELRMRAERRVGVLLARYKAEGRFNKGAVAGGKKASPRGSYVEPRDHALTLDDLGIDKKLSSSSQQLAAIPPAAFEKKLTAWRSRLEQGAERVSRAIVRDESKGERRASREAELADKITALPAKRYGVILADPEWRFEPRSRATGLDRSADNHYPTSSTDEIAMRPVDGLAAEDCVLFLWATAPMLPDALRVMAAWGFAYKSQLIWRKAELGGRVVLGTGYWFRNAHELLLVGTRGNVPAPAPGTQSASIVDHRPLKHSEKPAIFHELIEGYFPNLPKIELNARTRRPGWDAWGNEAPELERQSETLRQPREGVSRPRPKTSRIKRVEIARAGMPARVQRGAHRAGASRPANSKRRGSQ